MSILDNALTLITLLSLFLLGPALGRALVACFPGWQDWSLPIQHLVVGICTMIAVTCMVVAYGALWKVSPKSVAWYGWIQEGPVAGNVNVTGIRKVYENWRAPQADQLQAEITTLRKTIQAYPMVPALKRIVAHFHHDPEWAAVRPPMVALNEAQSAALIGDLARVGFALGERAREAAE